MRTDSTAEMVDGLIPVLRESSMVKGSPLTSFEQGFVLKMKHAKEQGWLSKISDRQAELLDKLHEKHCR